MFQVMEIGPEGIARITEGTDLVGPPPEDTFRWVDLRSQDLPQLHVLGDKFGFHTLTLEDCANFGQRPKVEEYGGYLFLVIHSLQLNTKDLEQFKLHELHMYVGERYLVTVHEDPIGPLELVWKRVQGDGALVRRGADFMAYMISDAIVDTFFPMLDEIADEVEEVEETVIGGAEANKEHLATIFRLKKILVRLRKVLSPQRDTFGVLAKRSGGPISEKSSIYFRDIHDHLLRINETIDATRDILGNALDAYLWAASQRTNEIMKQLTLLSAIFLPLTFITGFFGQNFEHMPFGSDLMLYSMVAACIFVPAGMVYMFVKRQWV